MSTDTSRTGQHGGITWPFNSDAGLVFLSAHFATYRVILSVNFEPLYIGPIMSASAEKGDRKREIEQSPIKKKFKDSTISREDLDLAIANGVKLALKEQQSTLNSAMASAVRDAVDSSSSSSWALLSFRYMWGHTVERNVMPHRTTVLHKYRHTTMK